MKRARLALWLGLVSWQVAAAGFELNGRALGDRVDEVLNDPRYDCGGVSACFLFTACSFKHAAEETLHGVPLEALTLYYAGERVAAMEAQLAPDSFDRLLAASVAEYGMAEMQVSKLRVPGNAVYLWRSGARVMRLERFFAPTGRASVIITDRSFLSELVERDRQ
jgi:hypothetical protein